MRALTFLTLVGTILFLSSCGSDELIDPAGTCVTCTNMSVVIEACADGSGNLDVITTDAAGAMTSSISTDFNLQDFQVAQEATGSTCN